MEQIINNLLSNALKYTPRNGKVSVSFTREGQRGILRVQDTGIGIYPEYLPKIFNEFFQTKEAKMIDPDGSGLGLPLVKKIVESLGGTIRVASEKGSGSEFLVTFPQA